MTGSAVSLTCSGALLALDLLRMRGAFVGATIFTESLSSTLISRRYGVETTVDQIPVVVPGERF